jgi:hypothetical protein
MGRQNAEFVMNHVAWMLNPIQSPTMSRGKPDRRVAGGGRA